ncbi:ATP-binding protein [Rhizobium sp. WYJ-E13]|uniref:PAS domain-containing sensor histidine kinase n=1 Tax=Rhizobium sp. WYJ-E13 TaxID=2849093 RepID=UPI001C1EB871|nr:ATP-binding protein [Rhizobium sp. WYJ-E13]QWW72585.1 PAS domain-containing protein [Rhizobium sp. WYJ-E13]
MALTDQGTRAGFTGRHIATLSARDVPIFISFFDKFHICRFANEHLCRSYGRSQKELVGLHMRDLLGAEVYAARGPHLAEAESGKEVLFEAHVPYPDGRSHDAEIRYIPQMSVDGFEGLHILVVDIERQKHRFRSVFDGTALGFFEIDLLSLHATLRELRATGVSNLAEFVRDNLPFIRQVLDVTRVVDLNSKAMEMFGVKRDAAVGRALGDWCPDAGLAVWNEVLVAYLSELASYEGETVMTREDGTTIDVLVNCAFPKRLEGQVIVVVGVVDISRRLENERALVKVSQDLVHAGRIATLGELTASIAHEVNQPLGAIAANGHAALRWLNRPVADIEQSSLAIRRMIDEATRASDIITRVRKMAKNNTSERSSCSVESVIKEALDIAGRQLHAHGASIVLSLSFDQPSVFADRIQLQQVLINLLINAAQAMSDAHVTKRTIYLTSHRKQSVVEIEVADTGPGLGDDADRIFNAFYTTKPAGMGLGLSICKTIVEAHDGTIIAGSHKAGGAAFTFTLPLYNQSP